MRTTRNLEIDSKKCIGCEACTHTCPAGLIVFNDTKAVRTLRFVATCSETCDLCEKVCSEDAIVLNQRADTATEKYLELSFPLIRCTVCGSAYATEQMAEKVLLSVSEGIKEVDSSWVSLCPQCKKNSEAVQMVGKQAEIL